MEETLYASAMKMKQFQIHLKKNSSEQSTILSSHHLSYSFQLFDHQAGPGDPTNERRIMSNAYHYWDIINTISSLKLLVTSLSDSPLSVSSIVAVTQSMNLRTIK